MTLYLVEQKVANTGSTWNFKVTTSYSFWSEWGLKRLWRFQIHSEATLLSNLPSAAD